MEEIKYKQNPKSTAIHGGENGEVTGYSNEAALALVEQAIEYGVKMNGGRKEAIAIAFAQMWMDGWCVAAEVDEAEAKFLHNATGKYFFI